MFSWMMFYIVLLLTTIWSISARKSTNDTFDVDNIHIDRASRAADYLIRKKQDDKDWNSLSPRVIIALAFAERAGIIPEYWLSVLKKEVGIYIKINIVKRTRSPSLWLMTLRQENHNQPTNQPTHPSLGDLALYINSLYATCQDPRHFHGIDLVHLLRKEANSARKRNIPFVLLTLCIAQAFDNRDIRNLQVLYRVHDDTLGSKALIIMALLCNSKARGLNDRFKREFDDFKRSADFLDSYDVYTKILHVQTLNALGHKASIDLKKLQQPDGSFGDILATYYAIPALLNTSLLDLKCKRSSYIEFPEHIGSAIERYKPIVVYSLWIEKDTFLDAHSTSVSFQGNTTFYDVMKMAEMKNSLFRFLYDVTSDGKKVYSLADIANDVEMGKFWTLYRGREDRVKFYSNSYLTKQQQGVERIFPTDGDHFVFWYERS